MTSLCATQSRGTLTHQYPTPFLLSVVIGTLARVQRENARAPRVARQIPVFQSLYDLWIIAFHLQGLFPRLPDSHPRIIYVTLFSPGGANDETDTEHSANRRVRQRNVGTSLKVVVESSIESIHTFEIFCVGRYAWHKSEDSECERGRSHEFEIWTGANAFHE